MTTARPLIYQFEDALGELVDKYLVEGLEPDMITRALRYEASNDQAERLRDLRIEEEKAHLAYLRRIGA